MPTIVEALVNCAEEDRLEVEELRDGVTPPTPCSEFIEALRSSVGVEEREVVLMELGERWRGLRGGNLPFGDALELLRCGPRLLDGEECCGEDGRAADVWLRDIRRRDCESVAWLLFFDGGLGDASLDTL